MEMSMLDKARKCSRQAQERFYDSICNIVEYNQEKNKQTKITSTYEFFVCQNQPCRISFSSLTNANQTNTTANISQTIKLFIAPEINIKPGSKIIVTQAWKNGRINIYRCSGQVANYYTHQEIKLELYEEYA